MTDDIVVHPIGVEAFALIAALYARSFDDPWPEPSVRELMSTPGTWGLIAERGGQPVGFLLGRVIVDEGEILSVGVDPTARRAGVGRALVSACMQVAQSQEAATLFLEVGEDNPAAQELYRALGFKTVGMRREYYRRADGTLVDASIMKVKLQTP
ncbi:ribosomal protein S18-alanine N-acetyltransferase [Rhodospirillaceae bacterium KN72]|uniref:[Ribosomal protein bS18]-alanine N-acetyltransferase n=1 Tax=Pacificispira spongiicola TaxID=2729598 RepID=A0A7Y0E0F1_9PROT|nr:ribosomal protein S18-alanine N-acetyltransferase [Pacificispira spongiicola]NMM44957.1 ribosomal protein S18-alanine N-acetyltransferase [Pacificispira spongiicola]